MPRLPTVTETETEHDSAAGDTVSTKQATYLSTEQFSRLARVTRCRLTQVAGEGTGDVSILQDVETLTKSEDASAKRTALTGKMHYEIEFALPDHAIVEKIHANLMSHPCTAQAFGDVAYIYSNPEVCCELPLPGAPVTDEDRELTIVRGRLMADGTLRAPQGFYTGPTSVSGFDVRIAGHKRSTRALSDFISSVAAIYSRDPWIAESIINAAYAHLWDKASDKDMILEYCRTVNTAPSVQTDRLVPIGRASLTPCFSVNASRYEEGVPAVLATHIAAICMNATAPGRQHYVKKSDQCKVKTSSARIPLERVHQIVESVYKEEKTSWQELHKLDILQTTSVQLGAIARSAFSQRDLKNLYDVLRNLRTPAGATPSVRVFAEIRKQAYEGKCWNKDLSPNQQWFETYILPVEAALATFTGASTTIDDTDAINLTAEVHDIKPARVSELTYDVESSSGQYFSKFVSLCAAVIGRFNSQDPRSRANIRIRVSRLTLSDIYEAVKTEQLVILRSYTCKDGKAYPDDNVVRMLAVNMSYVIPGTSTCEIPESGLREHIRTRQESHYRVVSTPRNNVLLSVIFPDTLTRLGDDVRPRWLQYLDTLCNEVRAHSQPKYEEILKMDPRLSRLLVDMANPFTSTASRVHLLMSAAHRPRRALPGSDDEE